MKTSWSRLGAAVAVAAPAAALDAACVGVPAALGRSWAALGWADPNFFGLLELIAKENL